MTMFNFLKKLRFSRPSLAEINDQTLEQARFTLADQMQAVEFHEAMIGMLQRRIARLEMEAANRPPF